MRSGSFFLGGLGDFWGGRRNFLIGLAGATGFTLLFAAGGVMPVLHDRLARQTGSPSRSPGAGLIKVTSKWFDYTSHGAIIGILSVQLSHRRRGGTPRDGPV